MYLIKHVLHNLLSRKFMNSIILVTFILVMILPIIFISMSFGFYNRYAVDMPENINRIAVFSLMGPNGTVEVKGLEETKSQHPPIKEVSSQRWFPTIIQSEEYYHELAIRASESSYFDLFPLNIIEGIGPEKENLSIEDKTCIISHLIANNLGLSVNDQIMLEDESFKVIGIFDAARLEEDIYISTKTFKDLENKRNKKKSIVYILHFDHEITSANELKEIGSKLRDQYFPAGEFYIDQDVFERTYTKFKQNNSWFYIISTGISTIIILYGLSNIVTVLSARIEFENIRLKILKAIGVNSLQIFFIEWLNFYLLSIIAALLTTCLLYLSKQFIMIYTGIVLAINLKNIFLPIMLLAFIISMFFTLLTLKHWKEAI